MSQTQPVTALIQTPAVWSYRASWVTVAAPDSWIPTANPIVLLESAENFVDDFLAVVRD